MLVVSEPVLDAATHDEVDLDVERLARARRQARGLRVAARRALVLARRYRDEEGPRGQRETACVTQALAWRTAARDLRSFLSSTEGPLSQSPGLARTSAPPSQAARRVS